MASTAMHCLRAVLSLVLVAGAAGCAGLGAKALPAGTTERLTLVNNCGDDAWLISTPPGIAAPVQQQWDWMRPYASATKVLPNGGTVLGVLLPKGESKRFAVPDQGAPGGNFRFHMNCPGNDPFDPAGCTIGSVAGDLAAINTLFEPTFGCKPGLSGADCAFNPSGDASKYPRCASDPSPANCPPMPPGDNFDVSAVDGYTVPMKVEAAPLAGGSCNRLVTDAGMLDMASCPTEDGSTLYTSNTAQQALIDKGIRLLTRGGSASDAPMRACAAPFHWFQSNTLGSPPSPVRADGACDPAQGSFSSQCFYAGAGCDRSDPVRRCPGGSGPQQRVGPKGDGTLAIHNTRWAQDLYGLGYQGYTWQYGDGVGDQACDWGSTIKVTLCPAGGVPYRGGQLWTFSPATGTCAADGSTGTPDGSTRFGSLAACQAAHVRYTCVDQTPSDPFHIAAAMWKADADATRAGTGSTPSQIAALRRLACASVTRDIPGFGSLTLPQCNYVYGEGSATCP